LTGNRCERGCGRLEWACLDWNQPSIDFYRSLGAEPLDEWTIYRVSGTALQTLAGQDITKAISQNWEELS
jgi:RimJ/RimL family protein N-acetyltransferase